MNAGTAWRRGRGRVIAVIAVIAAAFLAGYLIRGGGSGGRGGSGGGGQGTADDQGLRAAVEQAAAEVWTCSMHPQIRLPEPGKCPICFMDLIPAGSGAGTAAVDRRLEMTEAAMRLADIATEPAVRRPAHARIRAVGEVAFDETGMAEITAWVPGRIEKLFVNFTGARVRRGDRLAEIYSPELVSAQEELLQALRAFKGSTSNETAAAATLEAARERLRQYGLTGEQIDSIERERTVERNVVIHAPSSGVVVDLDASEGMYVRTGTVLMSISDLSKVWVELRAFQSDLPLLMEGQEVEFAATALPGERFAGEVVFVDPVLDPETMTAGVRAVAPNEEGRLRPEMFVSGEVLVRMGADGRAVVPGEEDPAGDPLLIPATAPLLTGRRAVVYVRLPGESPLFEGREVVLGPKAGDNYVVLEGLDEGELVVTRGAFKIDSELQIRAGRSMMSPGGSTQSPPPGRGDGENRPDRVSAEGQGGERPFGHLSPGAEVLMELDPVYKTYFEVQMALAGDDLPSAVDAYATLEKRTAAVDEAVFLGPARGIWKRLSAQISEHSAEGARSKDIESARKAFYHLSRAVIELHEKFGHSGDDFYLTFCPMARDNAGAFWIQQVDTVYNSFYGAVMLRCGSIEKKLPPAGGERE